MSFTIKSSVLSDFKQIYHSKIGHIVGKPLFFGEALLQERGVPPLPELDIIDRPFKITVRKIKGFISFRKLPNIQRWSQISKTSPYFLAWYCFRGELFDLQRSLLFSSSLLHLRCISGPRSTAIGPARSDCPSAIGWNRLHVKYDWSMVGKAEHRCVVIFFFFFPAVQCTC